MTEKAVLEKLNTWSMNEEKNRWEAYCQSEENIKDCEPFEQLNQKYVLLYNKYANAFEELNRDIESKVCRRAYASGGLGFPGGALSPSLKDLFVVGIDRGRLLKRQPKSDKYNYEYLFDAEDNLICIYCYGDKHNLGGIVLFVYENERRLSLEYDCCFYSLDFMTECQYEDGKLVRYEEALCSLVERSKSCTHIDVEIQKYDGNNQMQILHWYHYVPDMKMLEHHKYTFDRDDEGYLASYRLENLSGYKHSLFIDRSDMDNIICKKKRRK